MVIQKSQRSSWRKKMELKLKHKKITEHVKQLKEEKKIKKIVFVFSIKICFSKLFKK